MSTIGRVFSSSVGTKLLIGLTGLGLFAYMVLHLVGNVLIFAGPETFNAYSHTLISNPLLLPVEVGLLAIFLLHVYKAVTNYVANSAARPIRYATKKRADHTSRKSLASTTMIWSGLVVLVFIVIHIWQFRFGTYYETGGEVPIRDLARTEFEVFSHPGGSRCMSSPHCSSACTCDMGSRAASSPSASTIPSTPGVLLPGALHWRF